MQARRLRILVLSDLFPDPVRTAFGIFVERQVFHLQSTCDNVVVVPTRVFPHLRLWKHLLKPKRFLIEWRKWRTELKAIPARGEVNGINVYYPRYTSPPRQIFHGTWGFFAYLFLRERLRTLHRDRPFDLIHAHYASPSGVIALLARRWMKVPVVLSVHGGDVTYTAKQNVLSTAIIRWVFRNVDIVAANSKWTAGQIIRYGGNPEKVKVVHLGGNPNGCIPPKTLSDSQKQVTLLSVGYLEESKGYAYTLRAVRRLLDEGYKLHYVIVGDGSCAETFRVLANELDLGKSVSFEGNKSHDEVWSYFADCDIFVLPSWQEAFGVVYIEALASGKPVVGCEGEGGPEDLRALGGCIELVKPRNVASLVNGLRHLLDDPDRRRQMGELGRKIVSEHFTWEHNAVDTLEIYQQVLMAYHI